MEKLKVLQFIPSLNKYDGGTTTYMQQLAPALGREVELHVCALTPVEAFVPLEGCTPHSIPLRMSEWRSMKRSWMALLEEICPDIVHFNCCWMPQIAMVIHWTHSWRGPSSPYTLLTPHGMLEPWIVQRNYWTRKLPAICLYQRKALREVDCIVATAEEEREHLLQLGWNRNVAIVKNGICTAGICAKQEWTNRHRMLFMSRLHPKKGLEMLFQAMRELQRHGIALSLTVAGEGEPEYVSQLKAQAPSGVSFVGAVYGSEKWRLIEETDIVVLPSYSENYGLIIAEALATATPVIATTGAPWSSVEKFHAGWWVSPTVEGLCDALKAFADTSPEEMKELGACARRLAIEECDISQTAQDLFHIYQQFVRF